MLSTIIKGVILVAVLVFLVWLGACVYSNFIAQPAVQMDAPDSSKAAYSVYIKNTGGLILTDDYETNGTEVGSRIFLLHGFWEVKGQKFSYKATDLILNEAIFGEITVRRR